MGVIAIEEIVHAEEGGPDGDRLLAMTLEEFLGTAAALGLEPDELMRSLMR